MNIEQLRAEFEAHFSKPPFEWEFHRYGEDSAWPGNYQLYEHQCAWEAWQAGRAALLPVLQPEDQALLHEIAACLEADGAYMTADDVDMAVEIIRRILQQQAGTVLQSQHETQLQVWRSTDSCGEFWSWDEADQYDYDRAKPENRRVIQIIKEG